MTDRAHLEILEEGPEAWNIWRLENPGVKPQLAGEDLSELDLTSANLSDADLSQAELFDSTGLFKSLWLQRLSNVTNDAQGLVDELLSLEHAADQGEPDRSKAELPSTQRAGRQRRFGK